MKIAVCNWCGYRWHDHTPEQLAEAVAFHIRTQHPEALTVPQADPFADDGMGHPLNPISGACS